MDREPRPEFVVLDREYAGTTTSLRSARHDVIEVLRAHLPADQELRDRAELVVSELATNAIQAAPGTSFGLCVSLSGDCSVAIAITNYTLRDGGLPPRSAWGPAYPSAPRGRGLMIVAELTDEVEVEQRAAGTVVVTATFRTVHVPDRQTS
jgi:anti-sigma regulatory factor (Ser/Thr protein kinase)